MNKIFVEDFYDWNPTTLMASKSFCNALTHERTIIRLYSEIDYETNTVSYSVSESINGGIQYWKFYRLDDAVYCYNRKLNGV